VSLHGRPNHAELVARFGASHRFILDYVVEEVLAGLPAATQDFLLRTSILDRLTASLCATVAGVPDGQARLEELERANLLIVPLDDERTWYRYHALFAEILRARLGLLHPDEVTELHARAAGWHEAHGDDDRAIRHLDDALPVAGRSDRRLRRDQRRQQAGDEHEQANEDTHGGPPENDGVDEADCRDLRLEACP
jgi:ATP/maltotriose-dependent transcriptional regulator MalT